MRSIADGEHLGAEDYSPAGPDEGQRKVARVIPERCQPPTHKGSHQSPPTVPTKRPFWLIPFGKNVILYRHEPVEKEFAK